MLVPIENRERQMPYTRTSVPDLTGRTAVVTGANGGLGLPTAKVLAASGAHVVMAVRDQAKAAKAVEQSKLANYHFALGLQREFVRAGLPAHSLIAHPGLSHSDLQTTTVAEGGGGWMGPMWAWMARHTAVGPGHPDLVGGVGTRNRRPPQASLELGPTNRREGHVAAGGTTFEPCSVNVRVKISASWTSMLFIFAYVDLFSLYRPDVRADIEAGEVDGFAVNQSFLFGTTAYVVIPSLMVLITLVLRPRINRIANVALAVVYAITIIASAVGEWSYYILGSGIEVALLAAIVYYAWTWPRHPHTVGPNSTTQ
jgi:Family of unknown function (DUF6326)/short chain dehydrogenase